jgi:acylphosphatase
VNARAARFVVGGRVQGVGFRAWARREALALGLSGAARNLADGRVEVIVAGAPAALDAIAARLAAGPSLARVDAVERVDWSGPVDAGFVTG